MRPMSLAPKIGKPSESPCVRCSLRRASKVVFSDGCLKTFQKLTVGSFDILFHRTPVAFRDSYELFPHCV